MKQLILYENRWNRVSNKQRQQTIAYIRVTCWSEWNRTKTFTCARITCAPVLSRLTCILYCIHVHILFMYDLFLCVNKRWTDTSRDFGYVCVLSSMYWSVALSFCANAGKKESHLRVQTNVVIYIYIYFVFVMIVQIEHSADEWRVSEWEKEREKATERFAKCIEILQRIYKNIVFWAMNEVTIIFYYCLSFVRHNAKYFILKKKWVICVKHFAWLWFDFRLCSIFSFLSYKFSLINDIWEICQILTYSNIHTFDVNK